MEDLENTCTDHPNFNLEVSEPEPPTKKGRIEEIEESIDEFLEGFVPVSKPQDIADSLNMNENNFAIMSATDLTTVAFKMARYAAFIQKEYNKSVAMVGWIDKNFFHLVGSRYPKKHELARSKNLMDLERKRISAQQKIDSLSGLAASVNQIVKQLNDMARYKNSETFVRN